MKRETIVLMVKLVLDTSLTAKQTGLEIKDKLKVKLEGCQAVELLEADLLGCIISEPIGQGEGGLVN